ncbi:MAG TPA: ABC transporter ATP-binding protein [Clostridiales bacterium]|nr:ABC transporter ATP-binding protein [Clostridiales bacterium]HQP69170.1 ABC transporter ATP-binding protein [Clostridiales bacterium]
MYALSVKDLSFSYGKEKEPLFEKLSLDVERGSVVALTGKSGTGKSTLCYIMCGIIPKILKMNIKGSVELFGRNINDMKTEEIYSIAGIVFQDPETQLFMPSVEDELAFAPENLCCERSEINRRIYNSLKAVGMENFRYHQTNSLSGGQKQLIAIASVLTMEPEILIFDEIMSQLDKKSKLRIKEVINGLKNDGKTIVMVEHDEDNLDLADEVYHLENRSLSKISGRACNK